MASAGERRLPGAAGESSRKESVPEHRIGRVTPYPRGRSDRGTTSVLNFAIERTWDGQPVDHKPISIRMQWVFERIAGKPHKRAIRISFESPLFDDPDPPDELAGICPE
uniref:DUF3416 domain-containing protein n=1 Tax=Syphacia muris TaxID=451379 RepID=A0A0N5AVK9_9BILA